MTSVGDPTRSRRPTLRLAWRGGARPLALAGLAALALGLGATAVGAAETIRVDPARPSGFWVAAGATPTGLPAVRNGLSDIAEGVIGWFDYPVSIAEAGWYRVQALPIPRPPLGIDFAVDPADPTRSGPDVGTLSANEWVWLTAGSHRLRAIQNGWRGFSRTQSILLRPPLPAQKSVFRVDRSGEKPAAAIGQCAPIRIIAGGLGATQIIATFTLGKRVLQQVTIPVPASTEPAPISLAPPCSVAGDIVATLSGPGEEGGQRIVDPASATVAYTVFDTAPVQPGYRKGALALEIDPAQRAPDIEAGETHVRTGAIGAYRETGAVGMLRTRLARDPNTRGWFAYRVTTLATGRPYLMEVEYPDDADRLFFAAYRDSALTTPGVSWTRYAPSIGAETGGVWPKSGAMQVMRMVVWPASTDGRVLIFSFHDDMPAAVSKIRFYELATADTPARPAPAAAAAPRDAVIWYEEGNNFRSLVGLGGDNNAVYEPVDRFLRLARASGATRVMPTVLVYGHQLFPSRLNLTFNDQQRDMTAAFLLGAERYGLSVIPEIHPRADELIWTADTPELAGRRLLQSAEGRTNQFEQGKRQVPPHYNLLDPEVRAWYLGVVGEIASRYRDYPTFAGVSVRTSAWANGAFNNFVSLDWGYNPDTIRRFFAETGAPPPPGLSPTAIEPGSVRRWRDALIGGGLRERWIAWRCDKVADLYRDLVATVRAERADLKVVLDLSVMALGRPAPDLAQLREAGIDPAVLATIPGLEVLDARFTFGAVPKTVDQRKQMLAGLYAPGKLAGLESGGARPSVLIGMQYHELPGEIWPSTTLGFAKPEREPWVSAPAEPPPPYNRSRYARLLAAHDVYTIGTGGNGYVFDFEGARGFFDEFSALPRQPFTTFAATDAPLVARTGPGGLYVVNPSDTPLDVTLHLKRPADITRLSTGEVLRSPGTSYQFQLPAFDMRSFAIEGTENLTRIEAGAPKPQ